MKFNTETIINEVTGLLDISISDISYSPLYSTIGLVSSDTYSGVESIYLNYNRVSRPVWESFIKFEDGLVRVPSSMDKLLYENGNKKASIAFFDVDSFLIEAENVDGFELCGNIPQATMEIWLSSKSDSEVIFQGYSANGDARDPDKSVCFMAGIRAVTGSLTEKDGKVSVKAEKGKATVAFVFEALDIDEDRIGNKLNTAPKSAADAVKISTDWFVKTLGGFETEVESEREKSIISHAIKTLLFNSTLGQGNLNGYVSAFPSRGVYPTHFLWDSCFQNLALEYFDPRLAKDSMLLQAKCQRKDGKYHQFMCSTWHRPHETQPALVGWATLRIVQNSEEKDMEFIEEMFESLAKNNHWWLTQRMTRYGVIYCPHGLETGQDDSPRFDDGPVLAIDMNSYLLSQMKATAELANILGKTEDAEKWTAKAEKLAENMIKIFYDEEQNMFFDADLRTAERKTLWSASGFLPLWAGVDIGEDKAKKMIRDHLLDEKKFYGNIPIPCIAYDQDSYQAEKWWRGPTWMSLAWMVNEVLVKFGFNEEYEHVCRRFHKMILDDGNLRELFNSQTGEGLGAYDQGWTASAFIKLNKILHSK